MIADPFHSALTLLDRLLDELQGATRAPQTRDVRQNPSKARAFALVEVARQIPGALSNAGADLQRQHEAALDVLTKVRSTVESITRSAENGYMAPLPQWLRDVVTNYPTREERDAHTIGSRH